MSTRTTHLLSAGFVATALLLAGCGNDDTDGALRDTTTTTGVDGTTTTGDVVDEIADSGVQAQRDLEAALRNAGLTSLASAVAQVDLSDVVGDSEFTLFAPNDDAFLALSADDLTDLLADPTQIVDLIRGHIVVGEQITASDLADESTLRTEAGTTLNVESTGTTITVDGAEVVNTESAGNGVVHVVDRVLGVGTSS